LQNAALIAYRKFLSKMADTNSEETAATNNKSVREGEEGGKRRKTSFGSTVFNRQPNNNRSGILLPKQIHKLFQVGSHPITFDDQIVV
jgi:hypothetical protein